MSILKKYNETQSDKSEVLQHLEYNASTRSAWGRGVLEYARELVETLPDNWEFSNIALLEKELLNGASSWNEYSYGGCALIYDADICERLGSPSEQKRKKGGELAPNSRESWLDCQARALWQAFALVRRTCAGLVSD